MSYNLPNRISNEPHRLTQYWLIALSVIGIMFYFKFHSLYILTYSLVTLVVSVLPRYINDAMYSPSKVLKRSMPFSFSILFVVLYVIMVSIIQITKYYSVGGFIGSDTWFHMKSSLMISGTGSLKVLEGAKEYYYPALHILVAMVKIVLDVNIKTAGYVVISFWGLLITILFMYVLVLKLTGNKWLALLAAFIYSLTDFAFYWRIAPQTTSLGAIFYIVLVYLFYLLISNPSLKNFFISILVFGSLNITHPTSAAIVLIMITTGTLTLITFKKVFSSSNEEPPDKTIRTILGIFLVIFVAHNIFASVRGSSVLGISITNLLRLIEISGEFKNYYVSQTSSLLNIYSKAGNVAVYSLFIYSVPILMYVLLNLKTRSKVYLVFIFGNILGTMIIGYLFPLVGLAGYLVGRVFVFMYFCVTLIFIVSLKYVKSMRIPALLLIFALTASIIDPVFNIDNPPLFKGELVAESVTPSEFYGAQTLLNIIPKPEKIVTDVWYRYTVFYWWHKSRQSMDWWFNNPIRVITRKSSNVSTYSDAYFILRESYKTNAIYVPSSFGRTQWKFPYSEAYLYLLAECNKIYSTRDLSSWYIT